MRQINERCLFLDVDRNAYLRYQTWRFFEVKKFVIYRFVYVKTRLNSRFNM
jgi:hypothetical protein